MAKRGKTEDMSAIAFEAYGLRMAVDASQEVLELVRQLLPPGAEPCPPDDVLARFVITRNEVGTYSLSRDGENFSGTKNLDLDLALALLESQLRIYLGRRAPDAIFVHAGAVAHRGEAIVLPGMSFAGKTTLVAALVKAGAVYYSDEFAVIDREGLVHPYAKALSIRAEGDWLQTDHAVESFGGVAGDERLPIGMIVITNYRPDAQWDPTERSAGAGAMALLANAVAARERSEEVLAVVSRAAEGAIVIESDRAQADAIAPLLLQALKGRAT